MSGITFVQQVTPTSISTGGTKTFAGNTGAGNLLVATLAGPVITAVSSIMDTQGNTWHLGALQTNNPGFQATSSFCAYALNTKGGACTVTFNFTSGGTPQAGLIEYSGVGGFDQAVGGNGATSTYSLVINLARPNELVVGRISDGGGGGTYTPLAGCSIRNAVPNGSQTVEGAFASAGNNTWGASVASGAEFSGSALCFYPTTGVPNSLMLTGCGT